MPASSPHAALPWPVPPLPADWMDVCPLHRRPRQYTRLSRLVGAPTSLRPYTLRTQPPPASHRRRPTHVTASPVVAHTVPATLLPCTRHLHTTICHVLKRLSPPHVLQAGSTGRPSAWRSPRCSS